MPKVYSSSVWFVCCLCAGGVSKQSIWLTTYQCTITNPAPPEPPVPMLAPPPAPGV